MSQRAAAERRGRPETSAPTGAEEARVSEGRGGEGGQTEGAAAGLREDRQCQQDTPQEAAGAGGRMNTNHENRSVHSLHSQYCLGNLLETKPTEIVHLVYILLIQ